MTTPPSELPTTIAYHILAEIRMRIITGDYPPGMQLREQELEQQFGSSRGPIREALRLLLQNGLVVHAPRRGFKVRDYTAKDLHDIYRLRATMEELVLEELRGQDLGRLVVDLRRSNKRMQRHVERQNRNGFFEENAFFHGLVSEAVANEPLQRVMTYVNEISLPVRYRLLADSMPSGRSVAYHDTIIDALAAGDIDQAKAVARQHIIENLDRAVAAFAGEAPTAAAGLTSAQ
ncbi:MAG: GntR family transcriptional regulator [Geminicoccaceae bacterium]|nr:MAG: GntR family transcriptional regulator [Geminicoccaceae bacterium]